jgi:ribosomal protein S18 acetylase RimI-like enzyme
MEYSIREATPYDYEALLSVFDEGDAHHRRALPHIFREPDGPSRSQAYLNALLADDNSAIFVAECEGQTVGVVQVALRETRDIPILVPRRYAHVDTLIVLQAYRRAGIGKALMGRAHRWAIDKGTDEVELNVWEFNVGALAFYEALGYTTTRRTLSRHLPEE